MVELTKLTEWYFIKGMKNTMVLATLLSIKCK